MTTPADAKLDALLNAARQACERAYAPYSGFAVGAAVEAEDGEVFVGCNVENASFGATLCAERVAIANMVSSGRRRLVALAVYALADEPAMPCGICRQTLAEFGQKVRIMVAGSGEARETTLEELLPQPFVFRR
jgi:cytidine deaminase